MWGYRDVESHGWRARDGQIKTEGRGLRPDVICRIGTDKIHDGGADGHRSVLPCGLGPDKFHGEGGHREC